MLVVVQALTTVSKEIQNVPLRREGKAGLWANNHNATAIKHPCFAKIISWLLHGEDKNCSQGIIEVAEGILLSEH